MVVQPRRMCYACCACSNDELAAVSSRHCRVHASVIDHKHYRPHLHTQTQTQTQVTSKKGRYTRPREGGRVWGITTHVRAQDQHNHIVSLSKPNQQSSFVERSSTHQRENERAIVPKAAGADFVREKVGEQSRRPTCHIQHVRPIVCIHTCKHMFVCVLEYSHTTSDALAACDSSSSSRACPSLPFTASSSPSLVAFPIP
jgi:hypothetical protein